MTLGLTIEARLLEVRRRIEIAARQAGRDPASVVLVAVSKGHPAASIEAAYEAGQRDFGENYVQELVQKAEALSALAGLRWHAIGQLQRNKARDVAGLASLVHAVDRADLARELDKRARALGRSLDVLVEVNVAAEPTKGGARPSDVDALVQAIANMPNLRARGLMTIAPDVADPNDVRPVFATLRELAERSRLPELSMGMSHDFEAAITEGATIVRVGTAIFGPRAKAER